MFTRMGKTNGLPKKHNASGHGYHHHGGRQDLLFFTGKPTNICRAECHQQELENIFLTHTHIFWINLTFMMLAAGHRPAGEG